MRITVLTHGTRGDVQPLVALAQGLQHAGHRVVVAADPRFRLLIEQAGLVCAPVETGLSHVEQGSHRQVSLRPTLATLRYLKHTVRGIRHELAQTLQTWWQVCQATEAIVFSRTALGGYDIAQALQIPCIEVALQPWSSTHTFPAPWFTWLPRHSERLNRLSYVLAEQSLWQLGCPPLNHWRHNTLHVPPRSLRGPFTEQRQAQVPLLYGFSRYVVPRPQDWPSHIHVTGYWFLEQSTVWTPPAALVAFLANGPPPVYVGFGSMSHLNAAHMTNIIIAALHHAGLRGVLATGWGGLSIHQIDASMLVIDEVPHSWLFPQMAAVVHHGGAGTTAAALRAGVPSITIPFMSVDQHFWGRRIANLGAGLPPLSQRNLSPDRLVAALMRVVDDSSFRARAEAIGICIRAESGIEQAVAVVNDCLV